MGDNKMSEWISIEDQLPENNQRCLIWDKNCHVSVDGTESTIIHVYAANFHKGEHKTDHWSFCDSGFGNNQYPWAWTDGAQTWFSQDVTHWMPLPNPPEENK
jgi:hypothetical protein